MGLICLWKLKPVNMVFILTKTDYYLWLFFLFFVFCFFFFFLSLLKVDEELVTNSGKFLILDRMLPELKTRGHKVWYFWLGFWLYNYFLLVSIDTKVYLNFRCCFFHKWQECWTFWWITVTLEISTLVGLMDPCHIQREKKM